LTRKVEAELLWYPGFEAGLLDQWNEMEVQRPGICTAIIITGHESFARILIDEANTIRKVGVCRRVSGDVKSKPCKNMGRKAWSLKHKAPINVGSKA
jgi:hypothetical protein